MSGEDVLEKARRLPGGAQFRRCALQVNPHDYATTFRGAAPSGDPHDFAAAMIDKAVELGVSVLAITHHNSVESVSIFRAAAEGRGVTIFPGFELSSKEGIHVLCIYDPGVDDELLKRYLGAFGIYNTAPSSDLANKTFVEILHAVSTGGGVAVAAHATADNKGLLTVLQGQPRIEAWRSNDLLAIQIPGPVEDLPQEYRQIVNNTNAEYRRAQPAGEGLAVAVVNAADIVTPEDLGKHSATCWIKMSEVGIDGLRQAFLDPGSRIRLNPREKALEFEQHAKLIALAWEGGFLRDTAIHFNENLNVLVGGRGAGKSTVIESIRSVLGLDPAGDEAREAHEGVVRHVLKSGTKISLDVEVRRPAPRSYRIERTLPNPPVVKNADGEISKLSPRDVLPRIEIFGQHEISELTKSREKLTRLLGRFVERDEPLERRKSEVRRDLEKNRKNLMETRADLDRIGRRLDALPGLEETLARYKEGGLEERLREKSMLVREEGLLASMDERLAPFREHLESLQHETPVDRTFLSARALEELPGREILARANEVFERLDRDLAQIRRDLEQALQRAETGIGEVRTAWSKRQKEVETAYAKILRELQKSRVDGEEFIRLRRQIEELRPLREQQDLARRLEKEHVGRRKMLLIEWEDLKAREHRLLDAAAKKVSRRLRGRVQVEVTSAGNREPLEPLLREIGGRLTETIDRLLKVPDLSLPKLVGACESGAEALHKLFGIPPSQAERLARAPPELLMRIEELELSPTTTIQLNTAPAGDPPVWQEMDQLSTGQKATAVLLLLLLESDAPLIVDQPEDDLDNRFITEGVVPRMREEKQRRQFIFSTHNANIPVLGDAELIVGLSASGEAGMEEGRARIDPRQMGSIDDAPVREMVEEILEGGREAFERRRRKYGF